MPPFATGQQVQPTANVNGIAVVLQPSDRLRSVHGREHVATWQKPSTSCPDLLRGCSRPLA